ncbi:hypothetical protein VPNG_06418 [Cytospora leucostoma]|uniref:Uncharacterized protein n=1 Tax=Cytospora leucostoma TaxID=1230097 RepID=A0A423WZ47_9PEZI|nr:hypothetical protein VPNG_06418 [Cytospora leucostoma]
MTSPSTSASVSPYDKFRDRGPVNSSAWEGWQDWVLRDHDGTLLYDTPWRSLLNTVIRNNDVFLVNQWLEKKPYAQGLGEITHLEPFYTAIDHGSIDSLRLMLEYWAASPPQASTPAPDDEREYDLLQHACCGAQLDAVRLLIDESQPWAARLTRIHEREGPGGSRIRSALMEAASSCRDRMRGAEGRRSSEELICLLLDMGASARDVEFWQDDPPADTPCLQFTVLTLAIPEVSAYIVGRLIDEGADVHAKVSDADPDHGSRYYGPLYMARDATALHLGSYYFNTEAIQVLFDKQGGEVSVADMASYRDDFGRTPLHWATGSHHLPGIDMFPQAYDDDTKDAFTSKAIGTIKLLIAANVDTINARDVHGDTPLHLAVRRYKESSSRRPWFCSIMRLLCESGADASVRDSKGQTALHHLFSECDAPQPPDAGLAILLLRHGANVGDADAGGRTVMHIVAENLRHVETETVRVLLDHACCEGGDILGAVDAQGNTPLHVAAGQGDVGARRREMTRPLEAIESRLQDRTRTQWAMMRALLPPARGDGAGDGGAGPSTLDLPNAAGRTPRQLREETLKRWREECEVQQMEAKNRERAARARRGRPGRGRNPTPRLPSGTDSVW